MISEMRIGFDLDGVFADLDSAIAATAERLFEAGASALSPDDLDPGQDAGDTAPEQSPAGPAGPQPSRRRAIWSQVRETENFWETLGETEAGAVARLAALADEHRWEVVFLTQRPPTAGAATQRQSQRWLAARGFAHPSVCVVSGSRGKVAAALDLDLVVDDRPENCLDVAADSKAKAVLIWHGDQQHIVPNARRLGIDIVGSIGECLDRLAAGEWRPKAAGGLVGHLKRMIDPSSRPPE